MRYLSLFSGIEAASVAWSSLGWKCAAVAEIEKFPCTVLAHRYPDVPNLGDITKITEQQIKDLGHIDLIVGGFPCQDISTAGKRKGFTNDDGSLTRSGLFFTAMQIVEWARKHCGLRFCLLENVPGIFSLNKGKDFARLVEEMVGRPFSEPKKWFKEGVAVGERGLMEWCVLDAQWRGLAQRRKRFFALTDFGDWTNRPPILLERKSMSGDSPPSREAGKAVAALTANGVGTCGADDNQGQAGHLIPSVNSLTGMGVYKDSSLPSLRSSGGDQGGGSEALAVYASTGDISHCLNAGGMGRQDYETETLIAHTLRGDGFDASEDGTRRGAPLAPVAYRTSPNCGAWETGGRIDALTTGSDPFSHVLTFQSAVRRLTPRECERLQGFPDDWTDVPYRGKPAADGPRYKAIGNSMAVSVMRWIGERIESALEGS